MVSDRDKLERSVALVPAAAALDAKDRAALVKPLQSLVGQHSRKVESQSPKFKKSIEALTQIQEQFKDLNRKFVEERAALKANQNRCREAGGNFWFYLLKNNEELAKEITDQDEEVLKHLEDIKCSKIGNSKGLKMEFIFGWRPRFENSVLTKTYQMTCDNKPILEKATGTKIKWHPNKILGKNCPSFFNFFQPQQAADVRHGMQRDYNNFSTIWNQIIPQWQRVKTISKLYGSTSDRYGGDKPETMFLGERAMLEGKYQKLYEPLYKKRYEIVNGASEVKVTKRKRNAADKTEEETGVPYFWTTAMKSDEAVSPKITKRDEEALKYLKDIKWCRIEKALGFKLEFSFNPNPFFENTVLTKTFQRETDVPHELEKTIGTKIKWHSGKRLTADLQKRPTKQSKMADFMIKHQSFFNFFNTPKDHEFPYDSKTYMYHDEFEDVEAESEVQRYLDYEFGKIIRDKIIPHAESLFFGEEVDRSTDCADLDDDDDLNDDDSNSDNDSDNEDGDEKEEKELDPDECWGF